MSKPTRDSVPWTDVVEAARMVGVETLPENLTEACNLFADEVDKIAAATPAGEEPDLDPLVVDVFNNVIIFKVPVTGHPSEPAAPAEASTPVSGDVTTGVVAEPIPESPKKKKTKAEKAAEKKAAKEVAKAEKAAAKEAAKAEKKAAKAAAKAEKKAATPGAREKDTGIAAVLRQGILNGEPEGVVIQKAFEAYKGRGIPAGKDEAWALARSKRTYHHVYAILEKQGRVEPKPAKVKEPKVATTSGDETAPGPAAAESSE